MVYTYQQPKRKPKAMTKREKLQQASLGRAVSGQSCANYPAIFAGFMARGIPEGEIKPRVNVFTFNAWKAKGPQVRRGEKSVSVTTWISMRPKAGDPDGKPGRRPKTAYVFHVSQTDPTS